MDFLTILFDQSFSVHQNYLRFAEQLFPTEFFVDFEIFAEIIVRYVSLLICLN